jgi:hypothetical protein
MPNCRSLLAVFVVGFLLAAAASGAGSVGHRPGRARRSRHWTPADKDGYGTATARGARCGTPSDPAS